MIKKIFFFLCGSISLTQAVYGQVSKVKSPNEYMIITAFSDEFMGTTLNTSKWKDYDQSIGRTKGEYVYFSPNCVSVGAGVLKLTAKKEFINATDWNGVPHDHFYQSGTAVSKTFFHHGYYEIRAKMPNVNNTNGMAFWFWDRDANEVASEIDGFETQPVYKYRYPTATHYSTLLDNNYEYSLQNCNNTTADLMNGWHTYGVEWTPDAITYYIDGIVVDKNVTMPHHGGGPELSVSALRQMRLVLWNKADFGIEASTTGDVMEVDYFRYYKRKPSVYFSSYNAATGEYTYASKSNTPSDVLTWTYGSDIKDVNSYNAFGIQYLKFKRVSPTGTISITANAHQVLQLQDPNTTQEITTSSTFTVGNDNAYFYMDEPYYLNGKNAIKAYAASPNTNGIWTIGVKNTFTGTVDWSAPQTQTGTSATFTNLISGQTYTIKHQQPGAGSYLLSTQMTKDVVVSFDPAFYVDKIRSLSPTSNTVQMLVHQASTNPDSEWHLWLVNTDGSVDMTVDQPQWGQTATFNNLIPGRTYQVTHGNYGVNQAWVSSSKFVPVDFQSNFEFYDTYGRRCNGHDPIICFSHGAYWLLVDAKDYYPSDIVTDNNPSEYRIYELDAYGNHAETDPEVAPTLYGRSGGFPVQLEKNYMIKHGISSPNGYWTETRKTIHTWSKYAICDTKLVTNSEGEIKFVELENDPSLSIHENEDDGLEVFPNPTNGELHIRQLNKTYQKASILDPLGRVVLNDFTLEKESVDISQLPVGTYILKLESAEKGMKQIKIVKQ